MTTAHEKAKALTLLLNSDDVFGTTLLTLAIDRFTNELFDWTPEALLMEFADDFVPLSTGNANKLLAAREIVQSDEFFRLVSRFIPLARALNGEEDALTRLEPPTVEETAWAITEAVLLAGPEEEAELFSEEIRAFVSSVLANEGIVTPPDVLRIAGTAATADLSGLSETDAAMFNAEFDKQQSASRDVEEAIKTKLNSLVKQLTELPLQHGKTEELAAKWSAASQKS